MRIQPRPLRGFFWAASVGGLFHFMVSVQSRLLALSGQTDRTHVCPLLDNSGQMWILPRDGLSAYDPNRTWGTFPSWIAGALAKRADQEFRAYEMARFGRAAVIRYRSQRLGLPETAARLLFLGC